MLEKAIEAGVLNVAYQEFGPTDGWPVILGHGFPYDVRAYRQAAPILAEAGARVIVPWLRGYGATRFLSDDTPRSGEQAALGADMLALMDALEIDRAVLAGYDWGGRACCVVAALWPERVDALVSANSYNIQNIARASEPGPAWLEAQYWYQYYFHSERGRRGLAANRRDIIGYLWRTWSPTWFFTETAFNGSVASFDNPDFVDVVVHSYRHRYGLIDGDPAVADVEARLAGQPEIAVPAITIDGTADPLAPDTSAHAKKFTGPHEHRFFENAGHNLPQERPRDWAKAVIDARSMAG